MTRHTADYSLTSRDSKEAALERNKPGGSSKRSHLWSLGQRSSGMGKEVALHPKLSPRPAMFLSEETLESTGGNI